MLEDVNGWEPFEVHEVWVVLDVTCMEDVQDVSA